MDSQGDRFDVAVLGGGAAGLFAAFRAAERGRRVVLLEKNRRPGVKILMSGGTRCNLTNARGLRRLDVVRGPIDPVYQPVPGAGPRKIQEAFGPNGKFLGPALRALDVDRTIELFEQEGVRAKIEGNGKIFPLTDRAVDVLDALMARLERSGAELRPNTPVLGLERTHDGFEVAVPGGIVSAIRVILATGGQSYPGSGTTGDGYAIAAAFGHRIVPPRPALVPVRVAADWLTALKGITVPDAEVKAIGASGQVLATRREAFLIAHFGLTGPSMLDVSGPLARLDDFEGVRLRIDFLPEISTEALGRSVQESSRVGRKLILNLMPESLPRRLGQSLLVQAGIPEGRVGPELRKDERQRLVETLKGLELPVVGTLGFAKAEVTSGGVALDEVNQETAESRLCPGLHLIGEVLDLDGRIGGYNFQAAWSLGWLAGSVV